MTKTRKAFLPLLMMVLVFALAITMTAQIEAATTVKSGSCGTNLTYTLDSDGVLTISGTGAMTDWSYYSSVPWYSNRSSIKAVKINSGVSSIGESAFYDCSSLSSITIPDSVTSIGSYAFSSTAYYNKSSNWENEVLYIGNHLIKAKTSISSSYVIKEGTKTIAGDAFRNCTSLSGITIPDSVTSIGDNAFRNCTDLSSITIPDSVTSIGDSAFWDCISLRSITIPDSVTSIGRYAFRDCINLSSITIPDSVTSIGGYAFYNCTSLSSITIPDSVTSIGNYAFYNCTSLSGITIPDSVTSIGNYAFEYCTNLSRITIPDSVTSIGKYALGYYYSAGYVLMENFTIQGYAGSAAEDYATSNGISFVSLVKPEVIASGECGEDLSWTLDAEGLLTVSGMGAMTDWSSASDVPWYSNLSSIRSVRIKHGVTSMGSNAFGDCSDINVVIIPSTVTSIGDGALPDSDGLTLYVYSNSYVEAYAKEHDIPYLVCIARGICGENLSWVIGSEGVLIVSGTGAMENYAIGAAPWHPYFEKITAVIIESGATSVGNSAFEGCTSVTEVTLPDGIKTIGERAFYGCTALKEIAIPESATSIRYAAFRGCSALEKVIVPSSTTSYGSKVFNGCTNLTLYGYKGSKTETYATNNSIPFVDLTCEHSCDEWKIVTEPTCESDGVKTRACTKCGYTETETIPATGHSYKAVVTEPTCTEGGYTTHTCVNCGDTYTDSETEALGHDFGQWDVTEATCTEDGTKSRVCGRCGETETETIPATGHSYKAVVTEPTCTEGGYTAHTCVNCGDTYTDSETEALGHDFGEWVVDVEPTVDAEGSRSRKCSRCGEVETESIPKLEIEESGAVFTLSSEKAKPGENVKLTLSLKADTLISAIAISELVFDSEVLEFVGFGDYEQIEEKCSLPPVFDEELKCIVIALAEPEMFEGDICTLEFKVKEDATDCTTTVSANPLTKLKSEVVKSELVDGEVGVYTYVKGDIDGDEDVDIDDAVYLLCHSMLPDYYPVSYKGSLDIVPDGSIDQDDAVYLFNYSMLPDIYPIG